MVGLRSWLNSWLLRLLRVFFADIIIGLDVCCLAVILAGCLTPGVVLVVMAFMENK